MKENEKDKKKRTELVKERASEDAGSEISAKRKGTKKRRNR